MRARLFSFCMLLGLAPGVMAAGAPPGERAQQRALFEQAYAELRSTGSIDLAKRLAELADYPLAPYLEYFALRANISRAEPAAIERFLTEQHDLAVTPLLRAAWLSELAQKRRWREFLAAYEPSSNVTLQCYRLQAQATLAQVYSEWLQEARKLWLVGHSQPRACDSVFARLYSSEALSDGDVWARVELAMAARALPLARFLERHLAAGDRIWLRHWLEVDRRPNTLLQKPPFPVGHPRAAVLLEHGVQRLARRNPVSAWQRVEQLYERGALEWKQAGELSRFIALQAAYSRRGEALTWFDALPPYAINDEVLLWRAMLLRGEQDWPALAEAILAMPQAYREMGEWRYWYAYALWELDEQERARGLFGELASERHYYGFLAADALGQPYNMNAARLVQPEDAVLELRTRLGFERALELFWLGRYIDARREWRRALDGLSLDELRAAAVLAQRAGWYDRAIFAANLGGLHDVLELRFPVPHRELVERYSRANELDPILTFALLRKESAFMKDAVSHAGALGLMQVMPATGRAVARARNEVLSSRGLLEPDINLRLGSAYLRQVLDRFDNNPVLAAAAYNAGPHRVQDWLERSPDLPLPLWVENITFHETRDYVKGILAFSAVYDWRLNGEQPRRISQWLAGGASERLEASCRLRPGQAYC